MLPEDHLLTQCLGSALSFQLHSLTLLLSVSFELFVLRSFCFRFATDFLFNLWKVLLVVES